MDCTRVDEELIGFHLAAIDGATRAAVEAHLTGCARCVSAYLALKRAADAGEEEAAPSELTRARIRSAAVEIVKPSAVGPPFSAAGRKQPEAAARRRVGWAMIAAAAAVLVATPFAWRAAHLPSPGVADPVEPTPHQEMQPMPATRGAVDTARATPENLSFL